MKIERGIFFGFGAYLAWGLFPIYWKLLRAVAPLEVLSHRILWSFIFTALLMTILRSWGEVKESLKSRKTLLAVAASSVLIGTNWFLYIWGVSNGKVVECSLGYFILPLANVFLGTVFLKERLNQSQILAFICASAGIVLLTISYGALPWLSLLIAFTFAFYGFIRKTAGIGPLAGLTVESAVCSLPALIYILSSYQGGTSSFGHTDVVTTALLVFSGVVTALPLYWFASAARLLKLSTLGVLQYISPSIQFLLGTLVYHEPFTSSKIYAFVLIWTALGVFTYGGLRARKFNGVEKIAAA